MVEVYREFPAALAPVAVSRHDRPTLTQIKNGSPRGAAVEYRATDGATRRPSCFETSVRQEAVRHPDTGRQRTVGSDPQDIVLVVLEQLGPLVGQVLDEAFDRPAILGDADSRVENAVARLAAAFLGDQRAERVADESTGKLCVAGIGPVDIQRLFVATAQMALDLRHQR